MATTIDAEGSAPVRLRARAATTPRIARFAVLPDRGGDGLGAGMSRRRHDATVGAVPRRVPCRPALRIADEGRDPEHPSGFAARLGCGHEEAEAVPLLDGSGYVVAAEDARRPPHWRPAVAACGSIAFLGVAIEPLGLVPAAACAVLLAGLAERQPMHPLAGALQVGATATLGWLLFGS